LELFFQYLDESTLKRLRCDDVENAPGPTTATLHQNTEQSRGSETDTVCQNTAQESLHPSGANPPAGSFVGRQEQQPSEASRVLLYEDQFFGMPQLNQMLVGIEDDFGLFGGPEGLIDRGLEVRNFEMLERCL
jgi:hypothetical protein